MELSNTMSLDTENKLPKPKPAKKSKKLPVALDPITVERSLLDIEIKNVEGLSYLSTIPNNSIDLVLTDPPYIISKDSGMNEHYNNVKFNEENDISLVKTNDDWEQYKIENAIFDDENREKYLKYGSIYGKKYCVKTDYGEWDSEFTMEML